MSLFEDGYNVNPPPTKSVKPSVPPKAPPPRCLSYEHTPMLNSEKKQYVDKIRALQEELELVQTATIMKVNRIIRSVEFLTDEQKDNLILEINRK